jgi:hypothetical protein
MFLIIEVAVPNVVLPEARTESEAARIVEVCCFFFCVFLFDFNLYLGDW